MNETFNRMLKLVTIILLVSSCTKTRKAELAEEQKNNVFAINEFGPIGEASQFSVDIQSELQESSNDQALAIGSESKGQLHAYEASVPNRMKFMFENMPLTNLKSRNFQIAFSVDREYLTSFKIEKEAAKLSVFEKVIATTAKELKINADLNKAAAGQIKSLNKSLEDAKLEKENIISGKATGSLLVPLFKYKILAYGTVSRAKNELKEETARLELKNSEWKDATHIQIAAQTDGRQMVGLGIEQSRQMKQIFSAERLDNQVMSAEDLQNKLTVGMKFIDPKAQIFTRLDSTVLHIYEITKASSLNESKRRLLSRSDNQEIMSCQDPRVAAYIKNNSNDCVIVLKADIPIAYKRAKLADADNNGAASPRIDFEEVDRSRSVGLVEIQENSAAKQIDISGVLDPSSSIKLADIKGEFYYRRTFEAASNMFLGRTGTSGDMTIIRFELEDKRIVVRNQQSLISYTGQGAKDREELMSFPVKYIRLVSQDAKGVKLTIPQIEETVKEKAEYALIDWTNNTVPDAVSPLSFYAGGDCFMANSSLNVTDTDMRLATDGVLNYSLSGSYTVKPSRECVATKDVNSAYWAGSAQFNFNIKERISFLKRNSDADDKQFTSNISSMAQAAFNFGVFTLADQVTGNGALANREGSEKYMPILHDFRDGKILTYHLGGINNADTTSPERRELLVESAKQVIAEWNATLKLSFKDTPLARDGEYVKLVIDDANTEGHLGDLDRNYIWFQELPAENGLLGVAQPAANPRSGTIKSANVIIYTGNTFDQTERLLTVSKVSREYEKTVEKIKAEVVARIQQAEKEQKTPQAGGSSLQKIQPFVKKINGMVEQSIAALDLDNRKLQTALNGMQATNSQKTLPKLNRATLANTRKGQIVKYETNEETFMKKLTEIAVNKKASQNEFEFELELNNAFIQYGGLSEKAQQALKKRSDLLIAAIRFDQMTKNRPGCYTYSRSDVNDLASQLDSNPVKNLQLNFKKNVMSTLSHELGHAFGLLHNFKASTDKANYEFEGEKTGRNYSSIMDYIADIDMHYAGPGPYDAHAIRAAYTGLVEMSKEAEGKLPAIGRNLTKIEDVTKFLNLNTFVHLSKDTVNKTGLLKYYEQCDDTQVGSSALCARFDVGGSATEIVQNLIQDYNRGYINRNYVFDKILFDFPQKVQIINRNISTFQSIRSFLDEALITDMNNPGLTKTQLQNLIQDEVNAAKIGYQFFHELIRTPNVANGKILRPVTQFKPEEAKDSKNNLQATIDLENDTNKDGMVANDARFIVVPFKYKNAEEKEVTDHKIIEARSLYDIQINEGLVDVDGETETSGDRDKIDTVGISYDKAFAMMFLLQSTAAQTNDDSMQSNISYIDFEQYVLGIQDPTQSPTMKMILSILTKNLKAGFFAPTVSVDEVDFREINANVQVNRMLADRTAVGTIIGLEQNKWQNFDPFAEMFKVGKSSEASAPKDRLNAIKSGQSRGLVDTKVFYAPQNSIGSAVLVNAAARNEFFMSNKEMLFKAMQQILEADAKFIGPISKLREEACAEGADTEKCKAIKAKKFEEFFIENPELATTKQAADAIITAFVAQLREMNNTGLVIRKDLDDEKSPTNIERQVAVLRSILSSQLEFIFRAKAILESSKNAGEFKNNAESLGPALNNIRKSNQKLESLPLLSMGFAFIGEVVSQEKINLPNGDSLPLKQIARGMMNTTKVRDDLAQQQDVLEKLAKYSGLVDPDTILK